MARLINDIMNLNDSMVQLEREKVKVENRYNQFDKEHKLLIENDGKAQIINDIKKEKETLKNVIGEIGRKLSNFFI